MRLVVFINRVRMQGVEHSLEQAAEAMLRAREEGDRFDARVALASGHRILNEQEAQQLVGAAVALAEGSQS